MRPGTTLPLVVSLAVLVFSAEATANEANAARPAADDADESKPFLLVVRVSERLLLPREPREVTETTAVDDVVLGVRAQGTAYVKGNVSARFLPNQDGTGLLLDFSGTCVARTVSCRHPVVIHNVVTTQFMCQKPIVFDLENGFRFGSADSRAEVISTHRDVRANVPRLRGRIAQRVAWRQLHSLDGYLNEISRRNTERRIQDSFDREADVRLAQLNRRFHALRLAISRGIPEDREYKAFLNTTQEYLQIGVGPPELRMPLLPDAEIDQQPLEVWLHSTIFGPEAAAVMQRLGDLGLLAGPVGMVELSSVLRVREPDRPLPVQFSVAGPWVVIGAGRDEAATTAQRPQLMR